MHVSRSTFGHLLDFVDRFPGYFLGCNAALPRIGGSVLAHDHYQGGGELLPMHKAAAWATMTLPEYPDATIEILDWPGTAVRVVAKSRDTIIEVCDRSAELDQLLQPRAGHHLRRRGRQALRGVAQRDHHRARLRMSLIFRNNSVSEELPEGIFHAHPEFWPVKQEPIGLIEAQGLFILPGRLINQLGLIEDALAEGKPLPEEVGEFTLEWDELTATLNGERDRDAIHAAVQDELGSVCERILGNTAVFKHKELTRDSWKASDSILSIRILLESSTAVFQGGTHDYHSGNGRRGLHRYAHRCRAAEQGVRRCLRGQTTATRRPRRSIASRRSPARPSSATRAMSAMRR